jgi:uncharacterized protein (UPF0332 family)
MSSKELDNLVRIGHLKRERSNQMEIDGLLRNGRARLVDAKKSHNSLESRFDLAYNAAHAFSLAALRLRGYRPNKIRYIVFQALPLTLNLDEAVWRVLDKAHNLRNSAEYEGHFEVGEQLLNDLIKSADAVFKALQGAIKEQG